MRIGAVETKNNVFLAPMAGVTDSAFRNLCKKMGAGLVYSEMISAKAVCYNNKKTLALAKIDAGEQPIFIQLFGSEPDTIAKAIKMLKGYNPAGFDINMGCPTPKIVNNGEGSALLKNIKLAADIVGAAVEACDLPVSVKIRSGWDRQSVNAVEVAKEMQKSGASAICVHARTREQFYAPGVDLDIIKKVKQEINIPVIGNGDVLCGKSAGAMLESTGCDAVMIGRGALGNPWIFSEITGSLESGRAPQLITVEQKMDMALAQACMMIKEKGEGLALREMRKHLIWYLKGLKGASKYKVMASRVSDYCELSDLVNMIKRDLK